MPRARTHRIGLYAPQQLVAAAPTQEDEITVGFDGETVFNTTQSYLPGGIVVFSINGQNFALGTNFSFIGNTIVWFDNPFILKAGDCIVVIYNFI